MISDHKMPGKTGVELLTAIRAKSPGTARILLSGWTSESPDHALAEAAPAAVQGEP
mgnify:CR=1 FL=1